MITDFKFKNFTLKQSPEVMKVSTDSILLGCWANAIGAKNILDIGTGSGILALLMAQKSKAKILAIDVNKASVELAQTNFRNSSWSERLHAKEIALQQLESTKQFDLIISNPPYFESDLQSPYNYRNTARHSASLTFAALAEGIAHFLSEDGVTYICVPTKSWLSLEKELARKNLFVNEKLAVQSTADKNSYLQLLKIKKLQQAQKMEEIIIYAQDKKYTTEFIELTKEAYAHNFN